MTDQDQSPTPAAGERYCEGWTHCVCRACWERSFPQQAPHRFQNDALYECCLCGTPTDEGIYMRLRPGMCRGNAERSGS